MTLANPVPASPALPAAADAAAFARIGIVRVRTEDYRVGPWRYARLDDAMAEAMRGRVAGNDG